jgi:hypothetical protein
MDRMSTDRMETLGLPFGPFDLVHSWTAAYRIFG